MKVTVLATTLLATGTLAFPFFGNNNEARHDEGHDEDQGPGFLGIHWPTFGGPRPTATVRATPYYPYPYPTPTPTPIRATPTRRPGYPWYPTPTPTPGGSRPPWRNPDRLIYWHFTDARGKSFFVYCAPGEVINTRYLKAKGGPFICGKSPSNYGEY